MTASPTIAAKIRAALRKANQEDKMSYQDIAVLCGLSKQTIQAIVSNPDKDLNLSTAQALAQGLKLKLVLA